MPSKKQALLFFLSHDKKKHVSCSFPCHEMKTFLKIQQNGSIKPKHDYYSTGKYSTQPKRVAIFLKKIFVFGILV